MDKLFIIDYSLHNEQRTFIIRAGRMDNAEASLALGVLRCGHWSNS